MPLTAADKKELDIGSFTLGERAGEAQTIIHALADVVFIVTVLCFATDPQAVVNEAFRVLRSGGRLVLGELLVVGSHSSCPRPFGLDHMARRPLLCPARSADSVSAGRVYRHDYGRSRLLPASPTRACEERLRRDETVGPLLVPVGGSLPRGARSTWSSRDLFSPNF